MSQTFATRALGALAAIAFATLGVGLALTPPAAALSMPVAHPTPFNKCDRMLARDAVQVTMTGVPLPAGWTMVVDCEAATEGWVGQANFEDRVITRHLGAPNWKGDHRWNYLHEVGHAYDWERLSDDDRAEWMAQRGLSAAGWFAETAEQATEQWTMMPAEDWAESFATCHVGPPRWQWRLAETSVPTAAQCELLLDLAGLHEATGPSGIV